LESRDSWRMVPTPITIIMAQQSIIPIKYIWKPIKISNMEE